MRGVQPWHSRHAVSLGQPTTLGFVLLVPVDEKEAGALRGKGQQDALQQGRDEDEAQQEGPQVVTPHDQIHAKHLPRNGIDSLTGLRPL